MAAIGFADLSHYQASVDLAAYARAGYDRVFLKATQGVVGVDPAFAGRWKAAAEFGLARCAYHFAEAEDNGAADFNHFIAVVNAAGGMGPGDLLCLDSEDSPNIGRADEHAREFTDRAVVLGHPNGCLYTGRWFADPANLRPDDLAPGWRRLWISDYGTAADAAIALPAGWSRSQVIARQYTDRATTVAGVSGPCDANRVLKEWITVDLTDAAVAKLVKALRPAIRAEVDAAVGAALSTRHDPGAETVRELLQRQADRDGACAAQVQQTLAAVTEMQEGQGPAGGPIDLSAALARLQATTTLQVRES